MNRPIPAKKITADMEIKLRWFSLLAEKRGRRDEVIQVRPGMTGAELIDLLSDEIELLGKYREHIRLAVNREYTSPETVLKSGDEVAFITPVSGG
jgi:molybdopterin converting factor subunit 1